MTSQSPGAMTGVPGLDDILCGGLAPGRIFLLEGSPGTGKTTTALQFLLTGADAGDCASADASTDLPNHIATSRGATGIERVHVSS